MRLVKASEVLELTGLSADQLREWTTRRGLIEPDCKPHGPGSRALYSWQTVLLLRLAVELKDAFHVELHSQKALFAGLAKGLTKTSFPSLRGSAVVIGSAGTFSILAADKIRIGNGDLLILRLDPHLDVLSIGFGLIEPIRQLSLFPLRAVR